MMKVAVVGLGWWGRHLCRRIAAAGRSLQVVAAVTSRPEAAAGLATDCGLLLVSELHEVLEDGAIEGVILATPHGSHEALTLQALAAGKHVFCEKPLALTTAGARRMLRAAGEAGVQLGVGHERRWEPAVRVLTRRLAEGALGRVLLVEGHYSHDLFTDLQAENWLGPVAEVRAVAAKRVLDLPSGDVVSCQLRFCDGTIGNVSAVSATPFTARLAVYGDRGWVEIEESAHIAQPGPSLLTHCDKAGRRRQESFQPVDSVLLNLEAWAEAAAGKGSYPFTEDELISNVAVLAALTKSAASGQAEAVEI